MKQNISSDVVRQTHKFYAQATMLLHNFRYCTNDVKCMLFKSFCANMYCCPLWIISTSSSIKKLKTIYNSGLRNILLIKKHYSVGTMIISHGIPFSFFVVSVYFSVQCERLVLLLNSISNHYEREISNWLLNYC